LWSRFSERLFRYLAQACTKGVVILAWGKNAQKYIEYFRNVDKKYVIASSHPSPLSFNNSTSSCGQSFSGSKPFSKANRKLVEFGLKPVNWNLLDEPHPLVYPRKLK